MAKDRLTGKLAVILHADVAGSTALVQQDKELAHERIQESFRNFSGTIEKYRGHVLELRGDALLAEFEHASDAVTAALSFQVDHADYNARLGDDLRPAIRVGITMGEVVIADHTMTGAGVVQAQRVEQLADPGGVCITTAIHESLSKQLPLDLENLGEKTLKGFDYSIRVYRVELRHGASIPPPQEGRQHNAPPKTQGLMVAIFAISLVVTHLDTIVSSVGNKNSVLTVRRDRKRKIKLAGVDSEAAKRRTGSLIITNVDLVTKVVGKNDSVLAIHLKPMATIEIKRRADTLMVTNLHTIISAVDHKYPVLAVYIDSIHSVELAECRALTTESGAGPASVANLDSIVTKIANDDMTMAVDCYPLGNPEFPGCISLLSECGARTLISTNLNSMVAPVCNDEPILGVYCYRARIVKLPHRGTRTSEFAFEHKFGGEASDR